MKTTHVRFLAFVAILAAAACSSSPAPNGPLDAGGPGVDAGGPPADAQTTPPVDTGVDAPPACNDLAAAAPSVDYSLSDQANPSSAATGGTIADGTYYLTSYTVYGAGSVGSGFTANQATSLTVAIAGTSWKQIQIYTIEGTTSTVTTNYTAATSGSSITLTPSCPAGDPTLGTYTSTPTTLQLITLTGGFTLSEVFAKQ